MSIFRGYVVTLRVLPTAFYTPSFYMCTYLYTRVFPGRISGGFLVALRMFMCLRPRFSCGTCGAKCSCLLDFSSTSLQVPFTNWWHDFYLPTTYYVMSTSQSYICCYLALMSFLKNISAFLVRNFRSNL